LTQELPKEIEITMVFSIFVTYCKNNKTMPSGTPSLFIENIYGSQDMQGDEKSTSSKVPIHDSIGVLPLVFQSLLVTLGPFIDRLVFKLQIFS
jgi:hypothetical protein